MSAVTVESIKAAVRSLPGRQVVVVHPDDAATVRDVFALLTPSERAAFDLRVNRYSLPGKVVFFAADCTEALMTLRCVDYEGRPHVCSFPEAPRPVAAINSNTYTYTERTPKPWKKPGETP